ncbi:MAG TPA: alanine racemase [Candidatus Paceibacterota bacterium]
MRAKDNLRTWIEVDTKVLARNYRAFRKLIGPKVKLMAVVKSNAYGHSLIDFSRAMVKLGVDYLGVDSIVEAVALRQEKIKKEILVLGYTQPINFSAAAVGDITITISSLESLRHLVTMSKLPRFHLKLDTGMHRQGFTPELLSVAIKIWSHPKVIEKIYDRLVGVYSHLAAASSKEHTAATHQQIAVFENALNLLAQAGFLRQSLVKHLASTGGAIAYPDARFDLVRIGLGLYGLWPSDNLRRRFSDEIKLEPALSWKTIVSEVKTITTAGAVGYDFTERIRPGTKLAVCPIGYWHGFPRSLSSVGAVSVRGKLAKVIGRVSMDMIVIDVTRVRGAKAGDIVTLIGDGLPAERFAILAHTSPYEIITRLNPLIQKFYV